MVKVIYINKVFDADHRLGQFATEEDFDTMMSEDFDLYGPSIDGSLTEENIVAKFRKNWFTEEEESLAYEGLKDAAVESQNRGHAAGPRGEVLGTSGRSNREWVTPYQMDVLEFLLRPTNQLDDSETIDDIKKRHSGKPVEDTRGLVWKVDSIRKDGYEYAGFFDRWLESIIQKNREEQIKEAEKVQKKYISETNYAQSVMSGVAGYFDRYPRIPYGRVTSFNEKNPEKFEMSLPFLQKLDKGFKELLPVRWQAQKDACNKLDPRFVIDGTSFTTLTVNKGFRTAMHRDAGDLESGFSNIVGISKYGWSGGELVLPEFRVAVALQRRDLLLVANHTAIHGNMPMEGDRVSIVAYFREKMLELKSFEYEQLRKKFVYENSKNKNHPHYRPLFNGVYPGMWESSEWGEYLKVHNMVDEDGKVDVSEKVSLEDFF